MWNSDELLLKSSNNESELEFIRRYKWYNTVLIIPWLSQLENDDEWLHYMFYWIEKR